MRENTYHFTVRVAKFKNETGISLRYHSLRKTHWSMLAASDGPAKKIMQREKRYKYYRHEAEKGVEYI